MRYSCIYLNEVRRKSWSDHKETSWGCNISFRDKFNERDVYTCSTVCTFSKHPI